MRIRRSWGTAALAATLVAVLGTGLALAAIPGGDGVIHGCYKDNGDLRVIDPSSPKKDQSACKNQETALDWNQEGPQGPPGPKGDTGSPGTSSGVQTRVPGAITFDATATPVVSLTLPAGSWMIIGHAEMIAGAGLAAGRCFVATDAGSGPLSDFQTNEPYRPVVSFQSAVSLSVPKTVNVLCQVISGAAPITAQARTLMAIQVGSVTAQ